MWLVCLPALVVKVTGTRWPWLPHLLMGGIIPAESENCLLVFQQLEVYKWRSYMGVNIENVSCDCVSACQLQISPTMVILHFNPYFGHEMEKWKEIIPRWIKTHAKALPAICVQKQKHRDSLNSKNSKLTYISITSSQHVVFPPT